MSAELELTTVPVKLTVSTLLGASVVFAGKDSLEMEKSVMVIIMLFIVKLRYPLVFDCRH